MRQRDADVFDVAEMADSPMEASFGTGGGGRVESVAIPLEPAVAPVVFARV